MRTYEELVSFYEVDSEYARHPEVQIHAKAILELLPRIKEVAQYDQIVMGTAHYILWIGYDKAEKVVHIWGVSENAYELSVFNGPTLESSDQILVQSADVIEALEDYINKTR